MEDLPPYPPISPTQFDLILIGTGLPESILAAAASAANKTVLHLDPNPFYGSHFSSLSPQSLTSYLSQSPLFTLISLSSSLESLSEKFSLDLSGPRILFCNDEIVDLMIKSGASQYMEFKSVDASFIYRDGVLLPVPDSRGAVFRDAGLSLSEKTRLGGFFKMVERHLRSESEEEGKRIDDEDLERPFSEFLDKMRLSPKIKANGVLLPMPDSRGALFRDVGMLSEKTRIILYAIAMVDYDQDDTKLRKHVLKTKDGIDRLALYHSSVGRFSNAPGAMIYPIYGQGELPQAFCRRAAVKGCIYVLRMPIDELIMDKDNGSYKGVKIASGQELFSQQVVLGPSFIVSNSVFKPSEEVTQARFKHLGLGDDCGKVARGICITNTSLKQDITNLLLVYPPKSLHSEQVTSVRVLQLGSNLAICPAGMCVVYISCICDDADLGKKSLNAVVDSIFSVPVSEAAEKCLSSESESGEMKPTLLWSALYIQERIMGSSDTITTTSTPDGNLNYNDIVSTTKEQFSKMFPDVEFFPEASFVDPEDDALLDQSREEDSLES